MLWVNYKEYAYNIVAYNLHTDENKNVTLWVTRHNDKNLKVAEGEAAIEVKKLLDYAVENEISQVII